MGLEKEGFELKRFIITSRPAAAVKVKKTRTLLEGLAKELEQPSANLMTTNQFKRETVLRLYSMDEYLAMGCRSNRCAGRPGGREPR